jgi:predicted RNase H-like HicB family nuclease
MRYVLAMAKTFNIVIEKDADGTFVASVLNLTGCHTQAPTLEALGSRIREAIALHLEDRGDDVETLEFVAVETVTVAA